MKKIVTISLAVIIIVSSITGFASAGKRRLLNETERLDLYELGIMVGDEAGELHLGKPITRAEAVKMMCVAGGIEPHAATGQTCTFPDVDENHWAYQYICAAQSQGLIHGDEAGNFNPENSVTNEEIVKIIIRLLGYGVRADESGGYPAGYLREATRLGITTGLLLDVDVPAVRNDVGVMVYQALDVPVMEQTGDGEYVIMDGQNGIERKTLRAK